MRTPTRLLTTIGLMTALLCGAPTAAHATDRPGTEPVMTVAESVQGESWSAPAFPVTCESSNRQVSCTPTNPGDVKPQQCFLGVRVDSSATTVCTTYEGHVDAIQAAGGKPAMVAYGCSFGDVVCGSFENFGRGAALASMGMMFVVASNIRFDTSTVLWSAAVSEWSFWQWAILIVLFGATVWAITAAIVSGDRDQLVGALVRSFLAIPAVPITLWLTGHVLNAVDDMTWYIMNRDGPASLFASLQQVMWAGGNAHYFFAFVIHGLLMVSLLLLMLVFTFRNIVLAALIAVGPIAWMIFPVRSIGPQWVVRYASAVVVLLITGPLTIAFVTLIIDGLAAVDTIWNPQAWPLLAGLVLVAFAPFALFSLFSFVGTVAADSVGSRLGSHAASRGQSATRSLVNVPSRLGASPAGMLSRSRGSSAVAARPGGSGPSSGAPRGASTPAGSRTATPATTGAGTSSTSSSSPPVAPGVAQEGGRS